MPYTNRIRTHHGRSCPWCGITMRLRSPSAPSREHLFPRSRGGGGPTLIVCRLCNQEKGDMTLDQYHATLKTSDQNKAHSLGTWMAEHMLMVMEARALEVTHHKATAWHRPQKGTQDGQGRPQAAI